MKKPNWWGWVLSFRTDWLWSLNRSAYTSTNRDKCTHWERMLQTSLAYISLSRHLQAPYHSVKHISVLHLTSALLQTAPVKGLLHVSMYVILRWLLRKKSRNHTSSRMAQGFTFFRKLPAIAKKLKSLKSVSHISVSDRSSKPQRWRSLPRCIVPPEKLKSFSTRKPQAGAV